MPENVDPSEELRTHPASVRDLCPCCVVGYANSREVHFDFTFPHETHGVRM